MWKININKILIVALALLASVNSFAENKSKAISLQTTQTNILLTTPDTIKYAVFKRFNDIWIVYSQNNLKLNIVKKDLEKLGVVAFEDLITKNGSGFRIRFKQEAAAINFLHDYEKRTMSINISTVPLKSKKEDTIKFRVKNIQENTNLKQLFLDETFVLDYAYSLQTGEKYIVSISNDSRFRYPTKQINEGLYFLPTFSGAAVISQHGEFLKISGEDILELADKEDNFFEQADASFSVHSLDKFFLKNDIDLIEKQVRDYSKFNRQIETYKASKNYTDALKRLNSALSKVDTMDYLKDATNLSPKTVGRLDLITIQESKVFDMSGEDDGLFEIEEKAKKELKEETIEKTTATDVLVPDFSSDNLSFLMEKLRLASIKQTGLFQKEKITLKRMQISAYKSYFSEILDLTKLLRLNISGEFPKSNKGLALFALANAKIDRCNEIFQIPEKAGSIYTKDLRLWKAYCFTKTKKYESAVGLFKRDSARIGTYPKSLADDLMLSYAVALRNTDNFKHSTAILKDLEKSTEAKKLEDVKYELGLNYLYANEPDLAKSEFKDLLFAEDEVIMYKARLEYLNMLLQNKETTNKEDIIYALENLRFDFRGGDTELEATKVLASLYLQEDYIKQAMNLYKYISIYFSKTASSKHATETLFNIFYNLFAKDQVLNSNMNTIDKLALFYDFIELTPSEDEGNQIISNVVADLIDLGLYGKAIKLLTIQLNYKTKDADIAQSLGEKLADLYLETGQLKNALKTLKLTQKFEDDVDYTAKARLIKAQILIKQGKIKSAEKLLATISDSLKAKYALAEIYWSENKYNEIIDVLESVFLGKQVELNEQSMIQLSYLMLSYALTKDIEKLNQIKNLYIKELKKVDLEHKLEFLLKLAGADVTIENDDSKLLDIWQDVVRVDNESVSFINTYQDEVVFREALVNRDIETLVKYKDKLD